MQINNLKYLHKGCLHAFFDVTIPEWGLTIRDCALFEKNEEQWIGMPNKVYQNETGETKRFPCIILDQQMRQRFEAACLKEINLKKGENSDGFYATS